MFHIFAKKFHFGTPHLLDFQVAAWWLARLYSCFRKVAPFALPVEVFALVHCHHTPTLPLHPPPPPRARARSPRLVKPRHGWLGLAWYGMAWCESQEKDVLELCPRSFDVFLQVGFVVENPKPKQQVEQGLNMDRINEINDWFWNPV